MKMEEGGLREFEMLQLTLLVVGELLQPALFADIIFYMNKFFWRSQAAGSKQFFLGGLAPSDLLMQLLQYG